MRFPSRCLNASLDRRPAAWWVRIKAAHLHPSSWRAMEKRTEQSPSCWHCSKLLSQPCCAHCSLRDMHFENLNAGRQIHKWQLEEGLDVLGPHLPSPSG